MIHIKISQHQCAFEMFVLMSASKENENAFRRKKKTIFFFRSLLFFIHSFILHFSFSFNLWNNIRNCEAVIYCVCIWQILFLFIPPLTRCNVKVKRWGCKQTNKQKIDYRIQFILLFLQMKSIHMKSEAKKKIEKTMHYLNSIFSYFFLFIFNQKVLIVFYF